MKLSSLLSEERIRIPLAARTKEEALRELVSLLRKSDEEAEALLASVLEREKSMSTGIGRGIAIPHGKSPRAHGLELAFGISSEPIDYASLDRKPVRIFFLLVSPLDQASTHCEALGSISRILASDTAHDTLLEAKNAGDVLSVLTREEEAAAE